MIRKKRIIAKAPDGTRERPFFSIVTVTLNCVEDACVTAASVKKQTYHSYEYVIKDGNSSDDTAKRLSSLGYSVIVQADTGIYDAMNQALLLCKGRYVCFLNAGDYFVNGDTLAKVASLLEEREFPEFAYGDVRLLSEHPVLRESQRDICYRNRLSSFYLFRKMICHQAWFVKTKLIRSVGGFDKTLQIMSDYSLLLHMILEMKISYVHLPFLTTIYKGGGVTHNSSALLAHERGIVLNRHFNRSRLAIYRRLRLPLWKLVRNSGYVLYAYLPRSLRKRLHGL
jgi:glycosyltransferase involved in cell wall biosynthesis